MSVAVVFDSAGTLLHTYRVVKDVLHDTLIRDVETTTLTFSGDARALVTLYAHSREIIDAPPDQLLSAFVTDHQIGFGVACSGQVITADEIAGLIHHDRHARVGDLQECIRAVWRSCKKEPVVAMASGVIVNQTLSGIEFTVTSGGRPFPGAKSTISSLHRMGVATYIASGDRTDKLVKMADYLGIPHDNVHGVATPSIKAQVVGDLRTRFDVVVMVGDGINDIAAMRKADIAILSKQQSETKPAELERAARHTIRRVTEVVEIIGKINKGEARELCQYKE